jgi:hypothetical protein
LSLIKGSKRKQKQEKKKQQKQDRKKEELAQKLNQFSNDGSFLDKFIKSKLQAEP